MSIQTKNLIVNVFQNNFNSISKASSLISSTMGIIEATDDLDITSSDYDNFTFLIIYNTNESGGVRGGIGFRGEPGILITTTNLTEDGTHDYIYVQNPPISSVVIPPLYRRIFIRIMFIPSVWEPSASDVT
jgi:hypothetical protein